MTRETLFLRMHRYCHRLYEFLKPHLRQDFWIFHILDRLILIHWKQNPKGTMLQKDFQTHEAHLVVEIRIKEWIYWTSEGDSKVRLTLFERIAVQVLFE